MVMIDNFMKNYFCCPVLQSMKHLRSCVFMCVMSKVLYWCLVQIVFTNHCIFSV
ncbi:hypothetical protein ZOSMA_92G00110 [Zostera marina]|uniref:Uncharacterized protein n=1 Tax=Zostera marina TaxID=29655 RepID=A0A0K9NIT3_ZOSMR|nr:hypothetical protein ZOSMA_92G00110 [Zostera marina]